MNYRKIYDDFMASRFAMKEERKLQKESGIYFERHHIVPVSIGGSKSRCVNSGNIVLLTAREHFIAHWMLWLIYGTRKMAYAFISMTRITEKNKQYRYYSSRGYETARLAYSKVNKGNKFGKLNKGVKREPHSDEWKKNHSERMSGEKNPFFNRRHTVKSKNEISRKAKSRIGSKVGFWGGYKLVFKDGVFIGKYERVKDIAVTLKISEWGIKNVLGGRQRMVNGYEIKYLNRKNIDTKKKSLCSESGCDRYVHARGFCHKHYAKSNSRRMREKRVLKNISENPSYVVQRRLSLEERSKILEMLYSGKNVNELSVIFGVSNVAIYTFLRKSKNKLPKKETQNDIQCKEYGCENRCYCMGYCHKHYMRNRYLSNKTKLRLVA